MKTQSANYRAAERSQTTGPCFLYYFDYLGTKYYFTNFDQNVSLTAGPAGKMTNPQTFLTSQIAHDKPEQSTELNSKLVTVTLAAIDPELRKYFLTAPTKMIAVEVYRVNSTSLPSSVSYADLSIEFKGVVNSVGFSDYTVSVTCIQLILEEDRLVPCYFYQKTCNHILYGPGCKANKLLFRLSTTIAANSRLDRTIDITATTINVDSPPRLITISATTFEGGWVEIGTDIVGIISTSLLPAGAGTKLYLAWWPLGITNGASIIVQCGCRRTPVDCAGLFNNIANYGGMPYIPTNNPAIDGIHT